MAANQARPRTQASIIRLFAIAANGANIRLKSERAQEVAGRRKVGRPRNTHSASAAAAAATEGETAAPAAAQEDAPTNSTTHVALAIGEEVNLQTRLLDDLQDDVDVTGMRMRAATSRVRQIISSSATWKGGFCIFVLIITLVALMVIILKLNHLFG